MSGGPSLEACELLWRQHTPRLVALLARRHQDFAAAEDAAQEALLAAAQAWPQTGIPEHPFAWLLQVAQRRLIDQIRADIARRRRESDVAEMAHAPAGDDASEPDETLQLLWMCCHPSLSPPAAAALTLRAVCGLSTRQIARAYGVPEATVAQRITRAKSTLRAAGARFEAPSPAGRATHLPTVLHALYVMFSEGYASSDGDLTLRPELTAEAMRLLGLLHAAHPGDAETAGLLALMRLTDARRAARQTADGNLVPLDKQDRARWDADAIRQGVDLITRALKMRSPGPYQIQAAIAALHAEAPAARDTDWRQIALLYGVLLRMQDHPMIRLSHTVAIGMSAGPRAALQLLDAMPAPQQAACGHRIPAVRAHLHEMLGDTAQARACFLSAAARCSNYAEQRYLQAKAAAHSA